MTLRAPTSRWDYCVSAADQLMLWHGRTGHPHVIEEPLRTRAVVVLAACLADRAVAADLDGPAIADVPLADALHILERYPVSALEACRNAPADRGGDAVDELLALYGQPVFEEIGHAVHESLAHHLADGGPHVRTTDRRPALRAVNAPHVPQTAWDETY
ncbi:hypothetical protein [Streptomyces sp. OR43]|uniref:hypothetical protein n=1 Tax=Streptomyces sp. or43 TaxID=2478957 RepID=UPI0011CD9628|nr:hypothetical protein [Streptomyces sp. or43]TXS34164.1 hypothetical protein EAO72_41485 [Streptomyces sp. or43]